MKLITALTTIFFAVATTGYAQDIYKGFPSFVLFAEARQAAEDPHRLSELRTRARQGDADAQLMLGINYDLGDFVPEDTTEAARWFELAAKQGDAEAQYNLGLMYDRGDGVPEDHAEAARWYRMAAEQGDADAQFNLGLMYETGDGVPKNFVPAHMSYNIAAASGHTRASERRDSLALKMTSADVSEAQRRARVCVDSGYQDCGW